MFIGIQVWILFYQPPSGGCVLKQKMLCTVAFILAQPPSGGCVLKQLHVFVLPFGRSPAAFGRLCVETLISLTFYVSFDQPPSGGCVLKPPRRVIRWRSLTSRLRAAVC